MLSKKLSEEEVKSMFSSYGSVQDVSILRSADGKSKGGLNAERRGCLIHWTVPTGAAFVRMGTKSQAMQAISALHQSQTMPVSCSALCLFFICLRL